ncbi:MAG: methyltransferase domain-containing protein [Pseudomonadota bacterium]
MSQSLHDHTKDPRGNLGFYACCAERLKVAGVPVEHARLDLDGFAAWMEAHPDLSAHYAASGPARVQKCLEHHLTARLCGLTPGMTVIDVAAGGSPWATMLRRQGLDAFRLDMSYPPGAHGMDIGADATNTGLPDGFADALFLHCAYECFQGDADVRFLAEAARLLTPGGTLALTPLYLDDIHFVLTHLECPLPEGTIEPEATVLTRDDPWKVPFSRHYSPESFAVRIMAAMPQELEARVPYLTNLDEALDRWPDQVLYAFFTFVARRTP